jgi:hypothetical protein
MIDFERVPQPAAANARNDAAELCILLREE